MERTETVYHGTTKEAAENIVATQEIWDSQKNDEWLGTGAYFFSYLHHAHDWIRKKYKSKGLVVKAELEFDEENLLDLNDPEQRIIAAIEVGELYRIAGREIRADFPTERKELWRKWCFVCNAYRELHPEICVITYTFPQKTFSPVLGFYDNEQQWCVSDHDLIKSLELYEVRDGGTK